MRNKLYDAAVKYYATKLWTKLWDDNLFALKLSDGKTAYISIMGQAGEYNAIGIFVGEEEFSSYYQMHKMVDNADAEFERLLAQTCLQVAFSEASDMKEDELKEARAYARKNHLKFGKAYPEFLKFRTNYVPWKVTDLQDQQYLLEGMEASILLNELFEHETKDSLGFETFKKEEKTHAPFFEVKDGKLVKIGSVILPAEIDEPVDYVKMPKEIDPAMFKGFPDGGVWEAGVFRVNTAVTIINEDAPFYPLMLLVANQKHGYMLPVSGIYHEREPKRALREFADGWKKEGVLPEELLCQDERTYGLLEDTCKKLGIKLSLSKRRLKKYEEAKETIRNHANVDDVEREYESMLEFVAELLAWNQEDFQAAPEEVIHYLEMLADSHFLPIEMEEELTKKLRSRLRA